MSFDPMKKTADLLSICIKAGKTVRGFDSVCGAIENGSAACVLTASDASEKTVKEAAFRCGRYCVPLIKTTLSKDDMARLFGKSTAVIAVADKGFAEGFAKIAQAK